MASTDDNHAIDLSRVLNASHENKWVAIAPDYSRVIGSADSLRDLFRSVTNPDAIFHRVLPRDARFAPIAL
jgi:hypothetical protein